VKLAFLGTPEVSAGTLRALVGAGHDVVVVVTRADTRRGRGNDPSPSPVKAAAVELGLPVVHKAADVVGTGADLGVVVAYGRIIRPEVLAAVPMVNVHFSLLPRWRGAAPVERAILAGDAETGACLMQLEAGLDTGPVYSRAEVLIGPEETADELRRRLAALGDRLLLRALSDGFPAPRPQVGEPSYAAKLEASDLRLDFAEPAEMSLRRVRVGRAWTTWKGRRLLVHRARVVDAPAALEPGELHGAVVGAAPPSALELVEVQPEGKPAMAGDAWARGARAQPGDRLGA